MMVDLNELPAFDSRPLHMICESCHAEGRSDHKEWCWKVNGKRLCLIHTFTLKENSNETTE